MSDERNLNEIEPGNGPVDDRSANEADGVTDGAAGRGPAADSSSDAPAAGGPAPEGAPEEPPADRRGAGEEPAEPPTDWNYSSGGAGNAGGSGGSGGGSGRRKKGGAGNGGGRKRSRRTAIALVAVAVVAVVGLVAAIVALWPCDHEWAEATCTEPATCTKCGETEGKALGHDWQEATCTEPETCSRCGETQGDPLGHDVEEWTVTLEPTCGDEGEQTGTCTRCGEEVEEVIEPTGEHVEGEWSFTSSIGVKRLICSVCGEVMETQEVTIYTEGDYIAGVDLPAGEYKLYCTATSDEYGYDYGYYTVYADSSEGDLLVIEDVEDCAYLTLSDGQYVKLDEVVMVPIEDAEPMAPEACQGVYKVGYDIEPGEYRITPEADAEFGSYYIWETSDAVSIGDYQWVEMDLLYSSATVTVTEGQYLQLRRGVESIELVD